jgi:hypothetical protein
MDHRRSTIVQIRFSSPQDGKDIVNSGFDLAKRGEYVEEYKSIWKEWILPIICFVLYLIIMFFLTPFDEPWGTISKECMVWLPLLLFCMYFVVKTLRGLTRILLILILLGALFFVVSDLVDFVVKNQVVFPVST